MINSFRFLKADSHFYKGNLHCHSTKSDGCLSQEQLANAYAENGYSFLCFSEHQEYTDIDTFDTDSFIILPGFEWSSQSIDDRLFSKVHHVQGIKGNKRMQQNSSFESIKHGEIIEGLSFDGEKTSNEMSKYLKERGNISIYNHPVWSRTTPEDFGDLEGFTALEVYNHGCEVARKTGVAETYWDALLSNGKRVLAVATDDNHNWRIPDDSFGGWITVCAKKLTHDNVINSIVEGSYYSSSGPEIFNYGVKNNRVYVVCSPVNHVNFVAGNFIGAGCTKWGEENKDTITEAEFDLLGRERYIRIECVDRYGKKAWSNPLYFDFDRY